MDVERAAMKGRLATARERKAQLEIKVCAACDAIRPKLNCNLVSEPAELEIVEAGTLMDSLEEIYAELLGVVSEISRLEKALK
jgi:hypothetical protein